MRIFQVDAFTNTRFAGNPAIVVLDAEGLSDQTMHCVAREFSAAEVAFVSAADAADHDVRIRFFTPRKESAFVGHATIAAHAVLFEVGRRGAGRCRQRCGIGVIEVDLQRAAVGAGHLIEFRQSVPELEAPLPFKTTLRVAEALRLPATQLDEVMPARVSRKGTTRLLVPVAAAGFLDGLEPNHETLLALGAELGAEGFFVFALDRTHALSVESRMFCPALGIAEDPVSGNAHAMLAAYLWDIGQLRKSTNGFVGHQGRHVGRPGEVHITLEVDQAQLAAVRVGGSAVIVSEGTLAL